VSVCLSLSLPVLFCFVLFVCSLSLSHSHSWVYIYWWYYYPEGEEGLGLGLGGYLFYFYYFIIIIIIIIITGTIADIYINISHQYIIAPPIYIYHRVVSPPNIYSVCVYAGLCFVWKKNLLLYECVIYIYIFFSNKTQMIPGDRFGCWCFNNQQPRVSQRGVLTFITSGLTFGV